MLTVSRDPDHSRRFAELDEVRLTREVVKNGVYCPVDTRGVVVWCYPNGKAFEVEFFSPKPAVLTVMSQDLE